MPDRRSAWGGSSDQVEDPNVRVIPVQALWYLDQILLAL
jgi:hypothetical protein